MSFVIFIALYACVFDVFCMRVACDVYDEVFFVLSFFPWDVLDEILNLIESVSKDFSTYSSSFGFEINMWGRIIVLHFTSNYVIGIKVHVTKRLNNDNRSSEIKCCLVGCFGLSGPLRQYFSLYQDVSQRARWRKMNNRLKKKNPK